MDRFYIIWSLRLVKFTYLTFYYYKPKIIIYIIYNQPLCP
jgi:hypothetical protein